MSRTGAALQVDPALESLTSALVDANDRLLGLLALITDKAPASLDEPVLITAVIERAAPILGLEQVTVTGAASYRWGTRPVGTPAEWETSVELSSGQGPTESEDASITIAFARAGARFDTGDTKLLVAVARFIANAITTSRMHESALDQALVAKEHATAARITSASLADPDNPPVVDGVSVFANLVPARTTGGDLYAWREIGGDLWFALGDVSGKGLPAAVLMSTITSAIDAAFQQHADTGPGAVIGAVDRWLHSRLSESAMFVTLAVGCWSPATATLTMANAGHSPIVLRRNAKSERIMATAPPVGVVEGILPTAQVVEIQRDDLLVLATDGFTEQENPNGEMFGEDHFDSRIAAATGSAREVGEMLLHEIDEHSAGREQSDDRTLLVLHFS